jgi:hypothetical protein
MKYIVLIVVSQSNEIIRASLLCFFVQRHQTVSNVDVNCAAING